MGMLVNGGGAPEIEVAEALMKLAKTMGDVESYGVKAFARALEVIPYTLAENAGLDPVKTVTELRKVHQMDGDKTAGINVKRGIISSMTDEHVLQPALVTSNVIQLASETVCSILKIDDIVNTIRSQTIAPHLFNALLRKTRGGIFVFTSYDIEFHSH